MEILVILCTARSSASKWRFLWSCVLLGVVLANVTDANVRCEALIAYRALCNQPRSNSISTFLQRFTVDDRFFCFSCRSIQSSNPLLCLQGDADGGACGARRWRRARGARRLLLQSFIQRSIICVSDVELHVLESCLELSEALSTVHQHPWA